jgi:phosphonate C-P lyase system protein PhnG
MLKEQIFEALMQGDAADIAPLANRFRKSIPHEVIKAPEQELVMFQMEESVERIDFNVGEILVTSAEVRVANAIGYSMIMDIHEDKALDCALLMGIYEASLPEKEEIEALAESLYQKMRHRLREEREIVSSTRVQFEVMGGQDPNVRHNMEENQ